MTDPVVLSLYALLAGTAIVVSLGIIAAAIALAVLT